MIATVGVISFAAIGVFVISPQDVGSNKNTIATSASSSTPECSNGIPAGTMWSVNSTESTKLGFLMTDNSVGILCVTYTTDPSFLNAASLENFTEPLSGSVDSVNATYTGGVGWQYSTHPVPGIVVTPSLNNIAETAGQASVRITVEYTITVSGGVSGFFAISFTNNCPSLIPFAVGSSPAQLTAADFPGFLYGISCAPLDGGISSQVTGYSALTTQEITSSNTSTSTASTSTISSSSNSTAA